MIDTYSQKHLTEPMNELCPISPSPFILEFLYYAFAIRESSLFNSSQFLPLLNLRECSVLSCDLQPTATGCY